MKTRPRLTIVRDKTSSRGNSGTSDFQKWRTERETSGGRSRVHPARLAAVGRSASIEELSDNLHTRRTLNLRQTSRGLATGRAADISGTRRGEMLESDSGNDQSSHVCFPKRLSSSQLISVCCRDRNFRRDAVC